MTVAPQSLDQRDNWTAIKRGFVGHCPNCGEGHIFRAYLKVQDRCERCGEELHHQRADDAPPYLTILVVAHIIGFIMVPVLGYYEEIPFWVQAVMWPALVLGLSLTLLPRIKGALVGLQWAQRMHGFGEATLDEGAGSRQGARSNELNAPSR